MEDRLIESKEIASTLMNLNKKTMENEEMLGANQNEILENL